MNISYLWTSFLGKLSSRRFWQSGGLLISANLIVMALSLVRTPILTWVLPKEQVGMLGTVASWLPYLQFLTFSGMNAATYHYVAKGQTGAFVIGIKHQLRWSILGVVGFWVGAVYWWSRGDMSLVLMSVVAGLGYPLTVGLSLCASMLGAEEDFVALFWYRISTSLVQFLGLFVALAVWWGSKVVVFYAVNQLAQGLLHVAITLWILRRLRKPGAFLPPQDAREMVRYGRHLTVINGIGTLQSRTDAFLVGMLLPLETMADYSIALMIRDQFRQLWPIYLSIRYPTLVRLSRTQRQKRILWEGALVCLCLVGFGSVIAVALKWIVPFLLPASYAESVVYANWLIAAVLFGVPGGAIEAYFRMEQSEKHQYVMRIVSAIAGVLFPLILVFRWAVYGIIWGYLLANLVFSLLGAGLFVWELKRTRAMDEAISA